MPLLLRVVTPSKQILNQTCASVSLPGEEGEMGIFPGHALLVGLVGKGLIRTRGEEANELLIRGGFVHVQDDQVSILADEAMFPKDLDTLALTSREAEIQTELKNASLAIEKRDALYDEMNWIRICLKQTKS